jgi:hypothetical protein
MITQDKDFLYFLCFFSFLSALYAFSESFLITRAHTLTFAILKVFLGSIISMLYIYGLEKIIPIVMVRHQKNKWKKQQMKIEGKLE